MNKFICILLNMALAATAVNVLSSCSDDSEKDAAPVVSTKRERNSIKEGNKLYGSGTMVVGDMPFMSYQASVVDGMYNAARFLKETGCAAVKLEGGAEVCELVRKLTQAGIPVVGHIGLTPQSVNQLGGFKVQGKSAEAAQKAVSGLVNAMPGGTI